MVCGNKDKQGFVQNLDIEETNKEKKAEERKQDLNLFNHIINDFQFLKTFYNYGYIVGGTDQGIIQAYAAQNQSNFNSKPIDHIQAHYGQVKHVRVSPDGRYVFTAGILYIYIYI